MKKFLSLSLAMLMMASVLAGCGGSGSAPAASSASSAAASSASSAAAPVATNKGGMEGGTSLNFTTGGDQGTYYGFGGVLAGKVGESTSTTVTAITSGGSQANIEAMEAGDAQLGFVQSDVMAYAYNGTNLFDGSKIDTFSTVADLYMEQVQIVTLDANIKSVADLKGKNVSIGAAGSGVYYNAIDVLGAYGLTENDIKPTFQSFGDSTEALQDGKIDAAFVVAGAPTTAVTSLAATKPVYLVSLDDEHIDALIAESPYYSKNIISKDAYGTPEDVTTVAVGAVVIARDDVSEADVYNFLYGIFENLDAITAAHAKGAELNLEFAASVTAVPYHPGAAKYFAEKGITVPTK
ncbi:TAXI family TRAP transporter solute-binding subunit [uncultured Oscillibacter sp.]|uniref:TAXI family TRAP transporter solute-binding subunit n=1 Tax=uncultured Oscillibacter sp. TaxID=876091 RepID=UPI0025F35F6D|nr:TAXI family TRAP transporter solute-binding subunit [uncultured Oscillibacter sp.]